MFQFLMFLQARLSQLLLMPLLIFAIPSAVIAEWNPHFALFYIVIVLALLDYLIRSKQVVGTRIQIPDELDRRLNASGVNADVICVDNITENAYANSHNQIILTKSLIDKLSIPELCAIISHEAGHIKRGDVKRKVRRLAMFCFIAGFIGTFYPASPLILLPTLIYVLHLILVRAGVIPKSAVQYIETALFSIIFAVVLRPDLRDVALTSIAIFFVVDVRANHKAEFEADAFALKVTQDSSLADALTHFQGLPFELEFETHPSTSRRIQKLTKMLKRIHSKGIVK